MKKYDIFISYSRKDFDEVNTIVEMLKNCIPTLNCWFDITGIESGDEFEDKIITAIDDSSYVLFALSDNSIQSQWAKDEVMYAKNTDTKVIPLVLKGAQLKGWFLFKFGRIDCIDTTNTLQIEKLIKNLSDWTGKASVNTSNSYTTSTSNKIRETKSDTHKNDQSKIHTYYYSNGKKQYEGEMKNGNYHGQGTYYFADGDRYKGQFENGNFHGQGTYYYANGCKYIGQYKNGKRHGQGSENYVSGCKYEGQWKDDKKHGKGTFYWPNGEKYIGQWQNDQRHGQGSENYTNGNRYTGQHENGQRNGQGTMYYTNGDKYEGQWQNNLFNGQGTYYWADGRKYEGQWKDDKRHGQGTFHYTDGRQEFHTYNNDKLAEKSSKKSWKFW